MKFPASPESTAGTTAKLPAAPQILGFDIALSHFDIASPKLWHKNGVFDQILGCSGHFDVALEKWAPVALKTFYSYALMPCLVYVL